MTKYLIILLTCFISVSLFAQDFTVKSFTAVPNDVTAVKDARTDINGQKCAIIKVMTNVDGALYTAGYDIEFQQKKAAGEIWLWVSPGEKRLKVTKTGYMPLNYDIPERIEASKVYKIEIKGTVFSNTIMTTIVVQPQGATLTVNGKIPEGNAPSYKLPIGKNTLSIALAGYQTLTKEIEVSESKAYFTYTLEKEQDAALQIASEPKGATVILDGVRLGETPIGIFYKPGTYTLQLEKEGYVDIVQQLTVVVPQTQKTYTLEENVGYLTIQTNANATVTLNGSPISQLENIKLAPQVVKVKVSMPKAETLEQQVILKRNDHQTLKMYPNVQTGMVQVGVSPFEAKVELTGDAGEHYTATGMKIFSDIPVGNYTLKVSADGYQTQETTFALTANAKVTQNIQLEEGASVGGNMVFVKGGTFQMGCTSEQSDCGSNEKPVHSVTLSDYYISKYEVTVKEFRSFIASENYKTDAEENGYSYVWTNKNDENKWKWTQVKGVTWQCDVAGSVRTESEGNHPVIHVSWNDAVAYCKWISTKTGQNYRLPTEAEWEYAARGGSTGSPTTSTGSPTTSTGSPTLYAGSNTIGDVAWYYSNSGSQTHPVGQKQPNELGLYDMSGNVYEWCADWYGAYSSNAQINPQGASSGSHRVFRGGGWYSNAKYCRVAYRYYGTPGYSFNDLGFRIAYSSNR